LIQFITCGIKFFPISVYHGNILIFGYQFGNTSDIADVRLIPAIGIDLLKGIEVIVLSSSVPEKKSNF
jgi:hypothetical protein